ncbi:hypothetical protein [Mesoplasma lactucae]|uniref:Uncharacterized protein n=1 Tax=Mesoplasma lactucae ATCC 49193 TaxID=81460 RepID=A0A291IS68_9MOLU|nr:hypothetical protein [Mesoplasma lactucae]ATG97712.1 hypothetical protein CP520_03170 [Mesoplasma lactucae ATCC 49193]ATZ20513.1 hypothetical protein MLACT_v1c06920 [Mesoplasma lactucae ATCC 49193]MCL8216684.1 hypothetical protein [Mesoplasma lactucae ATCC 49193]
MWYLHTLDKYNYLVTELEWKNFVNGYKPNEQKGLEKLYKRLTASDKSTVRGLRILLDIIENDPKMKKELGINPFNLAPIGLESYVNFADELNLVVYKVNDFTQSGSLFSNEKSKNAAIYTEKELIAKIDEKLDSDYNYLKNFPTSYIIILLPSTMDESKTNIAKKVQELKMKSYDYDKKTNIVKIIVK